MAYTKCLRYSSTKEEIFNIISRTKPDKNIMKTIYIKKTPASYAADKFEENYLLGILADWFTDDVGSLSESWIEWLNDPSESAEATESNATWLEKDWRTDGSCIVTFGRIIDVMMAHSRKPYVPKKDAVVSIPKENVIELLDTWKQLLKTRPKQIMITEEDGIYKMTEAQ